MKNRILLAHSYFLAFDEKQQRLGQPYPPLGTLYAASVLRDHNYTVHFVDVMFANTPQIIKPALEEHPKYFILYEDGFNYLTKMCLTNMRDAALEMIALAKAKGCTVIVSSSDATDHYESYLQKGADYIILGEAEMTLLALVQTLEKNEVPHAVDGLTFYDEHKLVKTGSRAVLRNLDSLPLPAWDIIDLKPYKETWMRSAGYFSLNIGTTRGCPYKCNWCAKPIYGNRYNARSPQNVMDEIKYLQEHFKPDHLWFCDDIFGLKPGWVTEFGNLMQEEKVKIPFKIQSRADLLANEDYVASLAKAGCDTVWMGAESGAQKILDAMDKGTTVEQVEQATILLKKYKIKPCFFIQFGYPGETMDDIMLTVSMINRLMPHEIGISVSYPLPGTVFYEKVKAQLKTKANWTDSDEMALMFSNTFPPAFYKKLHRYVHRNYRKQLAIENLIGFLKHPTQLTILQLKKMLSVIYYMPVAAIEKRKLKILSRS